MIRQQKYAKIMFFSKRVKLAPLVLEGLRELRDPVESQELLDHLDLLEFLWVTVKQTSQSNRQNSLIQQSFH